MATDKITEFTEKIWDYYAKNGRHDLPWRLPEPDGTFVPYKILVSELMLQQTQVPRVVPKYHEFLEQFPSLQSLASAELAAVLRVWQGLGYNRRAKFLHAAAQYVSNDLHGAFPSTFDTLVALPGVGPNTAGAILAYAFNKPVEFLETNIRTVYIHAFFEDQEIVNDRDILKLVATTVDHDHPREWYWALMDYGSFLKQHSGNHSRRSSGYKQQSKFEGSKRQIRGAVIRALALSPQTSSALHELIPDKRLNTVLEDLLLEGLVQKNDSVFHL